MAKKIYYYCLLIILAVFLSLAYFFNALGAQDEPADAIAIRVMPNSEHLSPLRWYKTNVKNQGAPQNLTVDGYEAVRDGRTVYVNVGNVDGGRLFTNIYLLSYSQNAQQATEDIFAQLLTHWKFNVNLSADAKASVRRDIKRLADLAEMNLALAAYKGAHGGQPPALLVGSYLIGKSISKWPSWQETLGAELGVSLPTDPVNRLADCPGYADKETCWDEKAKTFYFNFNPNQADLKSISKSKVYWYADGAFHINLETNYSL